LETIIMDDNLGIDVRIFHDITDGSCHVYFGGKIEATNVSIL